MFGALITFNDLPRIGFAHHFYMDNYRQKYVVGDRSFEIVYVKQGGIIAQLYDETFYIQPGSLFVLFRHLPVELRAADGGQQAHCSVQILLDYSFSLLEHTEDLPENFNGLALPFVIQPGAEAESVKKELYTIVSQLGTSRESNALSASLMAGGILSKLDALFRQKLHTSQKASSLLDYKIKRYVAEHIHQEIPMSELAHALEKTPNYLNSVFKACEGISLHKYIIREKVRLIGELMENKGLSFQIACENVAISDISYGYRLFKKHMGVTPKTYLAGRRLFE